MSTLRKIIMVSIILFGFFNPQIPSADLSGNGGQFVSGQLKSLTTKASVNTLEAFSIFFKMLSQIEDPESNNITAVTNFGDQIIKTLEDSSGDLNQARTLSNSEFAALDDYIENVNFREISAKYNIPFSSPMWLQIIQSLQQNKGKGWLEQNLSINNNLLNSLQVFMKAYREGPSPTPAWDLMREWDAELIRGIYLSMIFHVEQ